MSADTVGAQTAPPANPDRTESSGLRIALLVGLVTLIVDQITKQWALSGLDVGSPFSVLWKLQFNLHFNTGSAFSLGTGFGPFIGVAAVFVSLALLWSSRRMAGRLSPALVGLIVGGAIGNVVDRLFRGNGTSDGFMRGAVVDFIDFQFWPIFNVADMAIVVGAILMVLVGARQ